MVEPTVAKASKDLRDHKTRKARKAPPGGVLSIDYVAGQNVQLTVVGANGQGTSVAKCPAGQIAISGGWLMTGTALPNPVVITESGLLSDNSGWYVDGYEDEPAGPDSKPGAFEAVANCAPTGGG